jgi:hypothetical protein
MHPGTCCAPPSQGDQRPTVGKPTPTAVAQLSPTAIATGHPRTAAHQVWSPEALADAQQRVCGRPRHHKVLGRLLRPDAVHAAQVGGAVGLQSGCRGGREPGRVVNVAGEAAGQGPQQAGYATFR